MPRLATVAHLLHWKKTHLERATFRFSHQKLYVNQGQLPAAFQTHPTQLVVSNGAGVHESLSNDQENSIHIIRCLHVKYELRVFDDVDPESQRQAVERSGRAQRTACAENSLLISGDKPVSGR